MSLAKSTFRAAAGGSSLFRSAAVSKVTRAAAAKNSEDQEPIHPVHGNLHLKLGGKRQVWEWLLQVRTLIDHQLTRQMKLASFFVRASSIVSQAKTTIFFDKNVCKARGTVAYMGNRGH